MSDAKATLPGNVTCKVIGVRAAVSHGRYDAVPDPRRSCEFARSQISKSRTTGSSIPATRALIHLGTSNSIGELTELAIPVRVDN